MSNVTVQFGTFSTQFCPSNPQEFTNELARIATAWLTDDPTQKVRIEFGFFRPDFCPDSPEEFMDSLNNIVRGYVISTGAPVYVQFGMPGYFCWSDPQGTADALEEVVRASTTQTDVTDVWVGWVGDTGQDAEVGDTVPAPTGNPEADTPDPNPPPEEPAVTPPTIPTVDDPGAPADAAEVAAPDEIGDEFTGSTALQNLALLWPVSNTGSTPAFFCVRQGATGANNGADWVNAYTELPATLRRNAVYYIADGTYPGYTFDDSEPTNGKYTLIRKAVSNGDHGTEVGWKSEYGDGQAIFTGSLRFETGYWWVDGQFSPRLSYGTQFGFRVYSGGYNVELVGAIGYIELHHIDIENQGRTTKNANQNCIHGTGGFHHCGFRYLYLHDVAMCHILSRGSYDCLVEFCRLARNGIAASFDGLTRMSWSGANDDRWSWRFNVFEDCSGVAVLGCMSGVGNVRDVRVYHNLFINTGDTSQTELTHLIRVKNSGSTLLVPVNWRFHHNVVANIRATNAGLVFDNAGSGNQSRNNLWWKCVTSGIALAGTSSHNFYYANTNAAGVSIDAALAALDTSAEVGTHDPYLDLLDADMDFLENSGLVPPYPSAGMALGNLYAEDFRGYNRSTWTRGYFEEPHQTQ